MVHGGGQLWSEVARQAECTVVQYIIFGAVRHVPNDHSDRLLSTIGGRAKTVEPAIGSCPAPAAQRVRGRPAADSPAKKSLSLPGTCAPQSLLAEKPWDLAESASPHFPLASNPRLVPLFSTVSIGPARDDRPRSSNRNRNRGIHRKRPCAVGAGPIL